ncbi:unnamed protein product [Timema podura]|uniref:Uncharacterized protein n=1 Tax=Timema podura TaxID=61482 RepID=A0ABN7NKN8_TIMPD|nr:unnamed protein product [Timema podura]
MADNTEARTESGWTVTVAGTTTFPQDHHDVEMRLSFPACSRRHTASQSDSGVGEDTNNNGGHHGESQSHFLPPAQMNNTQHWSLTVKNQTELYTFIWSGKNYFSIILDSIIQGGPRKCSPPPISSRRLTLNWRRSIPFHPVLCFRQAVHLLILHVTIWVEEDLPPPIQSEAPAGYKRRATFPWATLYKSIPKVGHTKELVSSYLRPDTGLPVTSVVDEETLKVRAQRRLSLASWPKVHKIVQNKVIIRKASGNVSREVRSVSHLLEDESGHLVLKSGLTITGSAITPEKKPRVPTMSERDVTRMHTTKRTKRDMIKLKDTCWEPPPSEIQILGMQWMQYTE